MSLLECICCRRHRLRTAVIWDDLDLPSIQTYSFLLHRACKVACYLRHTLTESKTTNRLYDHAGLAGLARNKPIWGGMVPRIGIYGSCNPEVISGLLGILAVPGVYVPVDMSQPVCVQRELMKKASVSLLLVHHSFLNDFLQQDWSSGGIQLDSSILEVGFVVAAFVPRTTDQVGQEEVERFPTLAQTVSPAVGESFDGTLTAKEGCSATAMCGSCTRFCEECALLHQPSGSEEGLLSSYLDEVQVQCHLCRSSTSTIPGSQCMALECESPALWPLPLVPRTFPAYVIHTSGTTGLPKGVCAPHCCIVPNIIDLQERFSIYRDDVIFNAAPLTFDPSVVELMLALSCGAALLTTPPGVRSSPSRLASLLFTRQRASVMQVTPALVYRFPEEVIRRELLGERSPVRVLAFGGESCPSFSLLAKWKDPQNTTTLFNIYGITEVSSWAACYQISSDDLWHHTGSSDSKPVTAHQSRLPLKTQREYEILDQVPIGEPLLGTRLEIHSRDGARITHGCGEIWIGGSYRVCLLEGESDLVPDRMRPTGDWGQLTKDGGLYCVCRTDRQIKRSGHRINLDGIQQTIHMMEEVSACAVTSLTSAELQCLPLPIPPHVGHEHNESKDSEMFLVVFVVPRDPHGLVASGSEGIHGITLLLKRKMAGLLPSSSIPDEVVLVKHLPTTEHGKIDLKALTHCTSPDIFLTAARDNSAMEEATCTTHVSKACRQSSWVDIGNLLRSVAQRLLGLAEWPDDKCLLDMGVNSFDVVRVSNQFELELQNNRPITSFSHTNRSPVVPILVEKLLSESLLSVALHVAGEIACKVTELSSEPAVMSGSTATAEDGIKIGSFVSRKRWRSDEEGGCGPREQTFSKRSCELTAGSREPTAGGEGGELPYRAWRRGQYFVNGRLQPNTVSRATLDSSAHLLSSKPVTCSFRVKWSINTGQCVDASPLVVQWGDSPPLVFAGSHSGLLLATGLHSGEEFWRAQLSDRIESSACVSPCGHYVIVGCYDGCVYALHAETGAVYWRFQSSQEPVKSSPCVDPANGLVWFGSHDQNLYALDIKRKALVHQVFLGGGACFSSPCVSSEAGTLYCATLQGRLAAIDLTSAATVKWTFQCPKPVFSSPALLPPRDVAAEGVSIGGVAIGCVDGCVYFIGEDGKLVAMAATEKPLFSSCCVTEVLGSSNWTPSIHVQVQSSSQYEVNSEIKQNRRESETQWRVFSGSHDKAVYCWNERLELEWRTELDSEMYSTPCLSHLRIRFQGRGLPNPSQSDSDDSSMKPSCTEVPCVCACSTAGFIYVVELFSGTIVGSHELPWDIFSSPVVVDSCIVVGCRDDHVYCIEIDLAL